MLPSHSLRQQPARRRVSPAFSLVEVVLALGVVAFAVVALLGLLTLSTNSSRSSDEDTVVASMARQVSMDLQGVPFSSLLTNTAAWPIAVTTTDPWPIVATDPKPAPPTYLVTLYFDNEGRRLPAASGAIYQCRIKLRADTAYNSSTGQTNLYRVRFAFSSALGANPAVLQTATTAVVRNE